MPFKPALQHEARAVAPEIEPSPRLDQEFLLHLPIAAHEELVHFWLSAAE